METSASIPIKFFTTIKTAKYSSWVVVPTGLPQVQYDDDDDGDDNNAKRFILNNSAPFPLKITRSHQMWTSI